jgi:hypothetical protein
VNPHARVRRHAPPSFGTATTARPVAQPPAGAVLGDPLSVPDLPLGSAPDTDPEPSYGQIAEEPPQPGPALYGLASYGHQYNENDVVWYQLPPELAEDCAFGIVHSDEQCPLFILRVLDEDSSSLNEITGSPEHMLGLAQEIVKVHKTLVCVAQGMTASGARGEAARREAG